MPVRELTSSEKTLLFSCGNPKRIEHVSVSGDVERHGSKVVAIVGARKATPEAERFAFKLAQACVQANAIVASGGALGVDAAAHRGALAAKGRTWAVLGTACTEPLPEDRTDLFAEIERAPSSSLIWPFPPDKPFHVGNYKRRNGYLVALADEVVVVQAGLESGSLNTANHARKAGRAPWIVPIAPWIAPDEAAPYAGNRLQLTMGGARALMSIEDFVATVFRHALPSEAGLEETNEDAEMLEQLGDDEKALLQAATNRPKHLDDLCEAAGLSPALAATALLTLALEHVLVEGPPGYYRRGSSG